MSYIFLALIWIFWCSLHSLMITRAVVTRLESRFPDSYRYYRMFFNMVSILTLIPVLVYSESLRTDPFFIWSGAWRLVQLVLISGALALFYAGGRHYDLGQFLGLRQVIERETGKGLTETGGMDTSGILGVIRHPWYSAGILIIWARSLDKAALVTNLVLTLYLVIGTILEEKKLVSEFGDQYRKYQKKVPMFFPRIKS